MYPSVVWILRPLVAFAPRLVGAEETRVEMRWYTLEALRSIVYSACSEDVEPL